MTDELDIDNILRSIRKVDAMMSLMLDRQQQVLTKYLPDSLLVIKDLNK